MVKTTNRISSLNGYDPYMRLCVGILKRAVMDTRGGDRQALRFLETEFARWLADAAGVEGAINRFCGDARLKFNAKK